MRISLSALLLLTATPALAGPDLTSQVPGLAIAALESLPPAPFGREEGEACSHKIIAAPETPAGRAALAQGWAVTSETAFGALTAIGFVGGMQQGTSGSCLMTDGNLGFFAGDRLLAVVYAEDSNALPIGFAEPFGQGGLRLWSGDWLPQPLADVMPLPDGGIAVVPLAPQESFCNGAATVPLIYGQPIDRARVALMANGWQPVTGLTNAQSYAAEIAAAGVPEVEECSGTGFGFCAYTYSGPAGTLGVTTMGEIGEGGILPAVVGYGVDCKQP